MSGSSLITRLFHYLQHFPPAGLHISIGWKNFVFFKWQKVRERGEENTDKTHKKTREGEGGRDKEGGGKGWGRSQHTQRRAIISALQGRQLNTTLFCSIWLCNITCDHLGANQLIPYFKQFYASHKYNCSTTHGAVHLLHSLVLYGNPTTLKQSQWPTFMKKYIFNATILYSTKQ